MRRHVQQHADYFRSGSARALDVRSLMAASRHADDTENVYLSGKTGSDRRAVKTTRLTLVA